MVTIPEGWFWMGSETGPENERPAHRIWVATLDLAAFQVTNAQYAIFLQATGHESPPTWAQPPFNHPDQPVVSISWFDAAMYCDWLSKLLQESYRLPTEAEWERAARGGVELKSYPWGDEPPESLPHYDKRWKEGPE